MNLSNLFLSFLIAICAGCASRSSLTEKPRDMRAVLEKGVTQYKARQFDASMATLDSVLEYHGSQNELRILAHKYLAFIYSIRRNDSMARSQFLEAFKMDSNFTLESGEMGNPSWMPQFTATKQEWTLQRMSKLEILRLGQACYKRRDFDSTHIYLEHIPSQVRTDVAVQTTALKTRAFAYALQKRPDEAKQMFKKAFMLDPSFELGKAEYGNPLWTPLYEEARREAGK